MKTFSLRMWRGTRVIDQKSNMSTAANSMLAQADELAVSDAKRKNECNAVAELAPLFQKEISRSARNILCLSGVRRLSRQLHVMPLANDSVRSSISLSRPLLPVPPRCQLPNARCWMPTVRHRLLNAHSSTRVS